MRKTIKRTGYKYDSESKKYVDERTGEQKTIQEFLKEPSRSYYVVGKRFYDVRTRKRISKSSAARREKSFKRRNEKRTDAKYNAYLKSLPIKDSKPKYYRKQKIKTDTGDTFYISYSSAEQYNHIMSVLISRYGFSDYDVEFDKELTRRSYINEYGDEDEYEE